MRNKEKKKEIMNVLLSILIKETNFEPSWRDILEEIGKNVPMYNKQ